MKNAGNNTKNKVRSITVKQKPRFPDASLMITTCKQKWAGHAARAEDNWAQDMLKWNPIGKRKAGRPKTKWTVYLVRSGGATRMREAEDREVWSVRREAFVQQWTSDGC